jgi:D-arabinose 5-phosphate isomerase GutQ/beta-phosphoglucomutase-like phosphatase (HAD superfamily)
MEDNKINILDYDLFIFDFDGTIMNTEEYHCLAWCNALSAYKNESVNISLNDYFKNFHSLEPNHSKNYLKFIHNIDLNDYDSIYSEKQKYYCNFINKGFIDFIQGAYDFLEFLIYHNKKFIIVSNTSNKFIETYSYQYPILNKAYKVYTKEYFVNRKPDPECYLHIINEFKNEKKICFEDSLVGFEALYQVSQYITPVFINNKDYYYNDYIIQNYKNIIISNNYDVNFMNEQLDNINVFDNLFVKSILDNNINQLIHNYEKMEFIINNVTILLKNMDVQNQIYMSGMGKSGYICKKCASTWQSLSIKCSYIDLPNLPHGDFGIFRDNDVLILISNGGNTEEIIYILKYIKNNLHKKINTISIVANENSIMEKYSNFTYVLNNITESDMINMTPSTSSLIFMSLLDSIAINLKKDITKEQFKLYHPSGSLGKR